VTQLTQKAKAAQAMTANAEPQRRALEEAQARAAALASELEGKSREIEAQAAQSQKAADAATKQKQATESTIAELRQSLEQEQKKTTALMQEAKAAQAMTANAEPQRRALEEAQARAAALTRELDGATKQKQAEEAIALELQKSLQQEREWTEAMARDLATVRRTMDGRVTVGGSADSYVAQLTQKVKAAATEPPQAAEAQGSAQAAK
jgi:chromosome segregation ATPase